MVKRIVLVFFTIPIAVVLIALAVANRAAAPVSLDVFSPGNPALTYSAPMFVWLLGAMAIGVLIGGLATWFAQGKHRKLERRFKREADELRYEVEDVKAKVKAADKAPGGTSLVMSSN
ncbi:MAG: LapA family protein [Pseudomonadota bacterium]